MNKNLFLFVLCFLVFGCSAFKADKSKMGELKVPQKYNVENSGIKKIEKWWEEFDNPELNMLVEKGLANNPSIKASYQSLKKARAAAAKQGAYILPDLDLDLDSSIRQNHHKSSTTETKSSSLGLAASYEIDLWNRLESEQEALVFSSMAAQKDLEASAVTLSANIANAWKDIVALRQRLEILKELRVKSENQLELLKIQFKSGMVKGSKVYEQKKDLLSVESDINSLESDIIVLKNKLSYLTGINDISVNTKYLPLMPGFPDTGIPADLLGSRPDIKASEFNYLSGRKSTLSAKKDRLPKISLSGKASITSDDFSLSFDDWLSQLALNLSAPVFKAGALKEEVKRAKAEEYRAFYEYASLFYKALNEVQDALSREDFQVKKLSILKNRIDMAKAGLYTAELEYKSGKGSYITIIDKYDSLKSLEMSYVSEKSNLMEFRVSLYRALGNNWTDKFVKDFEKAHGK